MYVNKKLFAVLLALLCGCACLVVADEEIVDAEDDVPVPSIEDLDGMIAYLRHGDERLIRYNVPSEEAGARQEKLCSEHLESLLQKLATVVDESESSPSIEDQTKLVQLVTLCSSENPENRQKIGSFGESVTLKAIVSLLDENNDSLTAVVGDAIWILSFANENNHNYFVENAIDKMASVLVARAGAIEKNEFESPEGSSEAALSVMWMAAAFQNLAASYCFTDSGHCWWEYEFPDEQDETADYGIYLHEESPMYVDATKAALTIASNKELLEVLHRLICASPMAEEDGEIWPSEAIVGGTHDPRIITWAVAGLLKNLSMYEGSHFATMDARQCLCALTQSEDWLESSKAQDALLRSGLNSEDCFGPEEEEDDDEEYYEEEL